MLRFETTGSQDRRRAPTPVEFSEVSTSPTGSTSHASTGYWSGPRTKGRRWLGLVDGQPVAKAYLSLAGPPGVAAIYGMSVRAEARGLGIAGALTQTLLRQAKALGSRRVVLHSSEMALGVYRRAGFAERCSLTVFATAPIWSGEH